MSGPASDRNSVALRFDGASVGYGERLVVQDASFDVAAGEFVGLVGPNGAGKSTLLRAVTGGADLSSGAIACEGVPIGEMSERERARRVGVVPQSQAAIFSFTARSFVEMGRHPHLGRLESLGAEDDAVVHDVMVRTDTAHLAGERVDELSGGDLQRLALAQALAQQPRILLLDEPTSHLDLNHALQVLDLVRSLADEGMAVLGVFHDLGLAARYADRIAVVADGRVTAPKPPADALDAATIADVFGVRAVVRNDPVTGTLAITPVLRGADLAGAVARPPIGLVCGSGSGASLMRRLLLAGHTVYAGALNRGDVDHAVAEAIGASFEELPPFGEIDAATEQRVRDSFGAMSCIVVCDTPFGRSNLPNLRAAVASGRPLVFLGEMGEQRDFAHGEALALVSGALGAGAARVSTEAEALDAIAAHADGGDR